MCGVAWMNRSAAGRRPFSTRKAHSWRDSANCSLTTTAFEMSTVPSSACGV
jgi:hypothetical protein